jgi:hypothetical protein
MKKLQTSEHYLFAASFIITDEGFYKRAEQH